MLFTDIRITPDGTLAITVANDLDMEMDIEIDFEDEEPTGWMSRTSQADSRLIVFKALQLTPEEAWNEERCEDCEPLPEQASATIDFVAPQWVDRDFVVVRLPISDFPMANESADYRSYSLWAVRAVKVIRGED